MSKIVLNPFSGQFDFVGSNSSTSHPTYELIISSLSQWQGPILGLYTITILNSVHNHGSKPTVQCLEQNGAVFTLIGIAHSINASGDVIIETLASPDNRFLGKIIITGE